MIIIKNKKDHIIDLIKEQLFDNPSGVTTKHITTIILKNYNISNSYIQYVLHELVLSNKISKPCNGLYTLN